MTHNIDVTKMDDGLFCAEKLAMANTAIGLARYYLSEYYSNSHDLEEEEVEVEVKKAKEVLDEYCLEVTELEREYYTYLGVDKELIDRYLGIDLPTKKGSWENID